MNKRRNLIQRWAWRVFTIVAHRINSVITGLILQQALILGVLGFGIAYFLGKQLQSLGT